MVLSLLEKSKAHSLLLSQMRRITRYQRSLAYYSARGIQRQMKIQEIIYPFKDQSFWIQSFKNEHHRKFDPSKELNSKLGPPEAGDYLAPMFLQQAVVIELLLRSISRGEMKRPIALLQIMNFIAGVLVDLAQGKTDKHAHWHAGLKHIMVSRAQPYFNTIGLGINLHIGVDFVNGFKQQKTMELVSAADWRNCWAIVKAATSITAKIFMGIAGANSWTIGAKFLNINALNRPVKWMREKAFVCYRKELSNGNDLDSRNYNLLSGTLKEPDEAVANAIEADAESLAPKVEAEFRAAVYGSELPKG